ncbi:hypothetical protein BKA70DRAFT_1324700 [Coprinopsis sp. MPI-PUGE-AT-0042]|nr:hypothetical protein BKA70DRAFT_1324700 [Coprinopsis sp. MPI-PUGE-AT-0042]
MIANLPFVYVQVEAQTDTTLDLLKSWASLEVESSICPPENKTTRISVSGYPTILPLLKSCNLDDHIHRQVLDGISPKSSVFKAAQPMLRWKTAGTIKKECTAMLVLLRLSSIMAERPIGRFLDAPYSLVFPGNLCRLEETLEDVHRTSAGQRKAGNSATRVSPVASCELEG